MKGKSKWRVLKYACMLTVLIILCPWIPWRQAWSRRTPSPSRQPLCHDSIWVQSADLCDSCSAQYLQNLLCCCQHDTS